MPPGRHSAPTTDDLAALAICTGCEAVHLRAPLAVGQTAECVRCGAVLETRKPQAAERSIVAALAMLALTALAAAAPFLTLSEVGLSRSVSLLDAAEALRIGPAPVGAMMFGVVVVLPALRALAHLYVLAPIRLAGRRPPRAAWAFRWACRLRPWAMAEIFLIGTIVSVVKLTGLATVTLGPAFWALGGAVLVLAFENAALCRESVWRMIEGEAP